MNRFIQRSIIVVSLYLAVCYIVFYCFKFNLWSQTYYLLFELFTCIFISRQGPFYCKYTDGRRMPYLHKTCLSVRTCCLTTYRKA